MIRPLQRCCPAVREAVRKAVDSRYVTQLLYSRDIGLIFEGTHVRMPIPDMLPHEPAAAFSRTFETWRDEVPSGMPCARSFAQTGPPYERSK